MAVNNNVMMTTNERNNLTQESERNICISKLKKQIEGVPNLENILLTDNYLLRFLFSTDFDVDEAFKRMKGYHQHMAECPSFYSLCGPLDIERLVEGQISTLLPYCDREGRPILLFKPANINTSHISLSDIAVLDDNWFEYILEKDPSIAGKGLCYILDVKNHSYGFIRWFNMNALKAGTRKIANLPFKEFVIHIINKSFPIQALSKVVLPLMPPSSKKQIRFHFTNWESLHKYVDPKYLPQEYGGTCEIDHLDIYQKFYERHDNILKSFEAARKVKKILQN